MCAMLFPVPFVYPKFLTFQPPFESDADDNNRNIAVTVDEVMWEVFEILCIPVVCDGIEMI